MERRRLQRRTRFNITQFQYFMKYWSTFLNQARPQLSWSTNRSHEGGPLLPRFKYYLFFGTGIVLFCIGVSGAYRSTAMPNSTVLISLLDVSSQKQIFQANSFPAKVFVSEIHNYIWATSKILYVAPLHVFQISASNEYGSSKNAGEFYPWLQNKIVVEPLKSTTMSLDFSESASKLGESGTHFIWNIEQPKTNLQIKVVGGSQISYTFSELGAYTIEITALNSMGDNSLLMYKIKIASTLLSTLLQ